MTASFSVPSGFGLTAACAFALLSSTSAQALPLNSLKGQGLDHIYGSYAPGGNCAREPRLTIADNGITFRALGREVTQQRVEYAASFLGPSYEGIMAVFFPFPVSDSDFGRVLMFVNDEEKRGIIRFDADRAPGQRADPFHTAFTGGGLFALCKGTAPANTPEPPQPEAAVPVPGTPAEWTNLPGLVGKYPGSYAADNIDLFDKGAIAAALNALLGAKMEVLKTNLSTVGPLRRQGNLYYIIGNAPHRGGEDQAYVLIDPTKRAMQVGLWEKGRLTVHAPASGRLPVPPDIATMLDNSPPETANAAPGTPWEVLPVQGRAPVAYVEAAASPSITSFTFYCENARPYMAMLLGKGAAGNSLTVTWNFAGRLVNIPANRGNREGTYWVGGIAGTPLLQHIMTQKESAYLRLNGRLEGEASLANATATLRTAMKGCVQL